MRYDVTDLHAGIGASALAINASGHIVGYYYVTGSTLDGTHGFLYEDGAITDIPTFGGVDCQATGINDNDVVVGWSDFSTAGFTKAFTFINGVMTQRGSLGGNASYAYGINNSGQIVGVSKVAGNGSNHAFRFSLANGTISNTDDLGTFPGGNNSFAAAITSNGLTVGSSFVADNSKQHAASFFLGSPADLGALPGADNSVLLAISENFTAVGYSQTSGNSGQHAVSYDSQGVWTDLGILPSTDFSQANGVNSNGEIVGWCQTLLGGAKRAFLYSGGVLRDLNTMTAPGSGLVITEANAITEDGRIVGRAINEAGTAASAVLLTPRIVQAPVITTRPKIKTKKKLTITGTASSEVSSVTYQIGKKPPQPAIGAASWSLRTPKLKPGKTIITITGHGYGGNSAPVRVTVIGS